ncbi:CGNR zinc finger domain-containing protein [Actinomadura parmotrematis]|uniref:ABATE domain-containing protein n=1 Tax=Actinomadura parmotrematis TaxID=2864039 RepID=A0ABS7FY68_9ACTN|nr:ABATE domain-containing protein [Actinomadura parmotrematis]MBW8485372.1 ABATE domain-containing protein [Actinomadura parmotrematis]
MDAFLSGRPCLDLTTTLRVRHREQPVETLRTPADLGAWIAASGLCEAPVEVDAGGLRRARALREAVYRIGHPAGAPAPDDVAALNAAASRPPLVPRLVDGTVYRSGGLDAVLSTLARDAIDLFGGPHAARVRECAHPDCSRLFLDVSHAGRRRWCGMAACGNKAKSAAYRRRQEQP